MVNIQFKESLYRKGKKKKKQLIFWQLFPFSDKIDVKTFLKWIINYFPKDTR